MLQINTIMLQINTIMLQIKTIMLQINTITPVFKILAYIITSITPHPDEFVAILAIMCVSTFKTVVILYLMTQLFN